MSKRRRLRLASPTWVHIVVREDDLQLVHVELHRLSSSSWQRESLGGALGADHFKKERDPGCPRTPSLSCCSLCLHDSPPSVFAGTNHGRNPPDRRARQGLCAEQHPSYQQVHQARQEGCVCPPSLSADPTLPFFALQSSSRLPRPSRSASSSWVRCCLWIVRVRVLGRVSLMRSITSSRLSCLSCLSRLVCRVCRMCRVWESP